MAITFSYTASEAVRQIQEQRKDDSRLTLSDAGWKMIAAEKQAEGYDKEAYEHALWPTQFTYATVSTTNSRQSKKSNARLQTYLLKLEHPLATAGQVKTAAGLDTTPPIFSGAGDDGDSANFCKIVGAERKNHIMSYLNQTGHSTFKPTFITRSVAFQRRINTQSSTLSTERWQTPRVLKENMNLDDELVYKPARVRGGLLKVWGNKYKALVDAPSRMDHNKAIIDGYAFTVENSMQEDALYGYETDKYEVVRCAIELPEECQVVKGLTFRFVGETK